MNMTSTDTDNAERRKHTRYDREDNQHGLQLNVARSGIAGFLKLNPTADCMDFSVSGLQFGSNQKFKLDEKLRMDLRVQDVEVKELNGVVVDCEEMSPGMYCTRVRFCFLERRMKNPRIMHALLGIEEKLRVAKQYPA